MPLMKRKKKPRVKSNLGLALIDLRTTGPQSFSFWSNSKSHNHFEESQWYITWACVGFLFCHLFKKLHTKTDNFVFTAVCCRVCILF